MSLKVTLPPLFVVPVNPKVACAISDQSQEVPQVLPVTPWVVLGSPGVLPRFEAIRLMKPDPWYCTPSFRL